MLFPVRTRVSQCHGNQVPKSLPFFSGQIMALNFSLFVGKMVKPESPFYKLCEMSGSSCVENVCPLQVEKAGRCSIPDTLSVSNGGTYIADIWEYPPTLVFPTSARETLSLHNFLGPMFIQSHHANTGRRLISTPK